MYFRLSLLSLETGYLILIWSLFPNIKGKLDLWNNNFQSGFYLWKTTNREANQFADLKSFFVHLIVWLIFYPSKFFGAWILLHFLKRTDTFISSQNVYYIFLKFKLATLLCEGSILYEVSFGFLSASENFPVNFSTKFFSTQNCIFYRVCRYKIFV